jgi:hypothetical protein
MVFGGIWGQLFPKLFPTLGHRKRRKFAKDEVHAAYTSSWQLYQSEAISLSLAMTVVIRRR